MTDERFSQYANIVSNGALEILSRPLKDSYLTDLAMMVAAAKGAKALAFSPDDGIQIEAGITLDDDINGLAEIFDDHHFCSVTYGHCVANLYCAETVLGTCALSDLGDAGGLRRSGQAMIPETGLIRDEPRFVDVMLSRRADDKKRSSISRFVSHLMFVFVLYHEIFHCTLGHCIELNKLNIRPRLREFGIAPEATTPEPWPLDDKLYHGFELSADSHAADGVMIAVLNKLDLPTRSGFFDESEFNRERLSLFAMSLVIAMWHEMDRNGEFDLLHPEPITRFLTVFDCVLNAATNRGGEELAVRLAKTLLNDLESAGSAIPEIDRAFNGLKNVNSYELVRESAALRKKVADNRFRIRRPL